MSGPQPHIPTADEIDQDHIADLLNKHHGEELTMPDFDIHDVRIIMGHNSADGTRLVYEYEGFKEKALGDMKDHFKYTANIFKQREIQPYTKEEFEKSCAGEEKGAVARSEYEQAFGDIEVAIYDSRGDFARGQALDMISVMEHADKMLGEYKQGIEAKQEVLDHQKHLMKDFSFGRAFEPSSGMELEGDRYTTGKYDIDSVAIEIAGDEKGAIIHMMRPEEGKTGEMNDAFVYRTREQLAHMDVDLITSHQLKADMDSKTLTFHERQDARSRILEMGYNIRDDHHLTPGVDLKEYLKGLETQQAEINSVLGAMPGDATSAAPTEPEVDTAVIMKM